MKRIWIVLWLVLWIVAVYVMYVNISLFDLRGQVREAYREIRELETAYSELEEFLFWPEITEDMRG